MQKGDFIRIDFIGRLESGEVFDLTSEDVAKREGIHNPNFKYRSLPVIVGEGFVISGLDKALLEMNVGEKREIEVSPEDGFGNRNPNLVRVLPLRVFEERKIDVQPGMIVDFGIDRSTGNVAHGRVQSVSAGRVRVDFNHPLAGKVLKYELEIREKIEGSENQIKSIFEFFGIEAKIEIKEIKENEKEVDIETIKLPMQIKERISSLITNYIKDISRVKFTEVFEKK